MDIVSRLKTYISYLNIQTTLFADNCKIPRPTLSQLLNGRNKKVSDELINKIHVAYPDLSMLWLMFGEGNMLITQKNETSEPQNAQNPGLFDDEYSNIEEVGARIDFKNNITENTSENISSPFDSNFEVNSQQKNDEITASTHNVSKKDNTITFSTVSKKKIVNIIVYYNDNSFESFLPSHSQD